jgi:hypothetical protein
MMKKVYLTDRQIVVLKEVLRKEAKTLGYPHMYDEYNRHRWPSRLKNLRTISKKLWNAEHFQ